MADQHLQNAGEQLTAYYDGWSARSEDAEINNLERIAELLQVIAEASISIAASLDSLYEIGLNG